jgi:hypothetical protein
MRKTGHCFGNNAPIPIMRQEHQWDVQKTSQPEPSHFDTSRFVQKQPLNSHVNSSKLQLLLLVESSSLQDTDLFRLG